MMQAFQRQDSSHASLIVEHTVPKGKGLSFRFWHANLTRSAKKYPGFIRTDLCPPVKGRDLKWYSIIHFDTPEHLNQWLKSDDRETLIQAGQDLFESYQFKSFNTGLEGWFSTKTGTEHIGLGPPAWKQNLAVVFGLYPVVMLQSMMFTALGIMHGWSPSIAMLINNLITSSILTWIVMPFVTRLLGFWLVPAYQQSDQRKDVLGTVIISLALIAIAALFMTIE